jgi:fatty acid-binding protein DegV
VHAHDPLTGQDVVNEVKKTFNCVEVAFAEISISLAVHFGPGTIGLAAYPE